MLTFAVSSPLSFFVVDIVVIDVIVDCISHYVSALLFLCCQCMRVCLQDVGGVAVVAIASIVVVGVFVANVVVCVRGVLCWAYVGMCDCVFILSGVVGKVVACISGIVLGMFVLCWDPRIVWCGCWCHRLAAQLLLLSHSRLT